MRSGVGVPPPSMPVLPPPMGPQVPSVLGMPSQLQSLPPPPPPSAPGSSGYLRKRKPGDGGDLPLSGMGLPAGARARQKINISHEELEARKKLSNIRVVQKNLVYVTNISLDFLNKGSANLDIPPGEFLSRNEYFGQYGEIFKLVVNLSGIYNANSSHGPTVSCYVTYRRNDDATACITAVNGAWLGGKLLRASNGTTKYCTYFLRGLTCSNVDCLYLHELGHDKDSFTKESMAADKNLFSESVHPKISFTERGENVLPPVHSNHMLDMSTLVIYERAATLFPPKYSDVLARSSNYIIITSPSKIITVFLSPASGSGASLGSLPPSSSSSSGSSNVSGTGMGPIAGTVSGLIQQSSVGSGSASSLSAMGTGAIPQGLSSPLISSTVPQHQPYGSHHHNRLQSHSPVSPPSSPKKGYGHVGSGAQMLSAYDGRSSMLFTEDSDEFPPLSPVTDTKGVKKERRSDGTVNDGTRTLAGTSVAGDTTNEHDNIGNRFGGDNNNNNNNNSSGSGNNNNNNNNNVSDNNNSSSNAQDKKTDEGMMDDDDNDNNKDNNDNDKEDERLRQERRKWRKKMWDFEVSKLGEEERALSDVIRSLDDEFEDSPALIRRVRGEDEDEFGGNPLLCALPPLDNISFNGSDQDQLASLICAAPGTLSTTTVAGSSVASDGDSIFSYGPVGFGPEYTAGLFPKLFGDSGSGSGSGNGNGYSGCVMPENSQNCVVRSSEDSYYYSEESRLSTVSGAESEEIMDDNRLVIMPSNLDDRFAEAALLSSADEERGLVGGGSSSNGDYGEEEEEDDDNDECDEYDDDNEYDEEEDDEEEEEKPRPRVLPRCSCCGGLILSSSPRVDTKKKGNNNNDSGDNNNNGDNNINNINNNNNNNNGNDNDDDDDDVPPELVNPSASEESVDSDDDDDNGSGLASPKSSSECSKSGKNSVLPSILDGDASVSASDHVAIHIPNSTILICPLYSRSSNRK